MARHLEVPEIRVSSVTPGLRAGWRRRSASPIESGRTSGNDRGTSIGNCGSSIRTQAGARAKSIRLEALTISPEQWTVSKKAKGNDKGPRRGWLGDLTDGILSDVGLYIGRSRNRPWRAARMGSLHSHQEYRRK